LPDNLDVTQVPDLILGRLAESRQQATSTSELAARRDSQRSNLESQNLRYLEVRIGES
jgi:hypothetical protein